jgi:hypothetical protein
MIARKIQRSAIFLIPGYAHTCRKGGKHAYDYLYANVHGSCISF